MSQPDTNFDKWHLVNKHDDGLYAPEQPEGANTQTTVYKMRRVYELFKDWDQDKGSAEKLKLYRDANQELIYHRNKRALSFWSEFKNNMKMRDETGEEMYIPSKWNGYHAGTAVDHVIYSRGERLFEKHPIQYLLQDLRNGFNINLVQLFRGAEDPSVYASTMKKIWGTIKTFFEQDGGEFVSQTLAAQDSAERATIETTRQEMIKLKQVMETATMTIPNNGNRLEMQYKGDRKHIMHLEYDGGLVEMKVWDGIPDVSDLNATVFPVRNIVNSILQKWKDASPGLLVSIIWKSNENDSGEHYLYLTEHQKTKLNASYAQGFLKTWNDRRENGTPGGEPVFQETQLAINKNVLERQTRNGKTWGINYPLTEKQILGEMMSKMTENRTTSDVEDFLRGFNRYQRERMTSEGKTKPKDVPIKGDVMQTIHFSANNLAFTVQYFNTDLDFVRKFFVDDNETTTGQYVQALVVRYPVLYLNIDKIMQQLRYMYFQRNSPDQSKWRLWRSGRWHIPSGVRDRDLPERYQVQPDPNDPLDWVLEKDKQGLRVYSMRALASLPQGASYEVLSDRNHGLSLDFFVNGLESDPNVVYKIVIHEGDEAIWDDFQLFRLNAEITVSRLGYQLHKMSFFRFRTEQVRQGESGHPFLKYLQTYPRLWEEWSNVWMQAYNNMAGFQRLEPRADNNEEQEERGAEAEQEQEQEQEHEQEQEQEQEHGGDDEREADEPQRLPEPVGPYRRQMTKWGTVCAPWVARLRKRNEKFLMHMMYDRFTPQ
jgi:hypothetical protein